MKNKNILYARPAVHAQVHEHLGRVVQSRVKLTQS